MSVRKSRYGAAAAAGCLFVALLMLLDGYGRRVRVFGLNDGAGRPVSTDQIARPADCIDLWRAKGYHGRIIVCLTGRWQPTGIRNEILDGQRYPLPLKNIAMERLKNIDNDNFLYVASAIGIARRIVTILPEEGYRRRREMARDIKTFKDDDGGFTLYFMGFAREFTTLASFRPPAEPVLLYLEDTFVEQNGVQPLLQSLMAKGLKTDNVIYARTTSAMAGASDTVQ